MVVLEFQGSPGKLADDSTEDLRTTVAGNLQDTCFFIRVRLQVGNVELLEMPLKGQGDAPVPWPELPILNVATVGLQRLREAGERGTAIYTLPGSGWRICFAVSGEDVSVYSEVNGRCGRGRYAELLGAFEQFAGTVRALLSREAPALQDHPHWGKWLGEGKAYSS